MSKSQRRKPDRTGQLEIFPTPAWPVDRLLDAVRSLCFPRTGWWLEPCAGEGHIIRAVDAWCARNGQDTPPLWQTTDIRPTRYAQPPCDMTNLGTALHPFAHKSYDVIITNPPFSKAGKLFETLWPMTERMLVFLLPVSWLGSGERYDLLHTWTPSLYVLPERPVFRGDGTDQEIYAWFVWSRGGERSAHLVILPKTPVAERRASEQASASAMPPDWQREVEARRAARAARKAGRMGT